MPDGLIGLYIGDVVGKDSPATMYGALVMGVLRGIHKSDIDTCTVLSLLNQSLGQRPLPGRFCATLYAVFDPSTRILAFSNAGLPFPLHASATEWRPALEKADSPPAFFPALPMHISQLSPGDAVLFANDGLHESLDPQGVEFSSARISELWAQCPSKPATESLDHLFDGLHAFSTASSRMTT